MLQWLTWLVLGLITTEISIAAPWTPENAPYNINQNKNTQNPLEYSGVWENHVYFPSPQNWRFPFYTLFLDRFSDSDPSNNDYNKTMYEFDPTQIHFRHGG